MDSQLVTQVKVILANNFALYLKAQYFHWNVEGIDFTQFHDFFGDFYSEVYGAIDRLGEEIRALDAYAPSSLDRFQELSEIKGEDRVLSTVEMVRQLSIDNSKMLSALERGYLFAETAKEFGLSNFIQDRIAQHKKHAWMLRSILKEKTQ